MRRGPASKLSPIAGIGIGIALAALLAFPAGYAAAQTDCSDQFAGGKAPVLVDARLAPRTHALCYSAYAVLQSGKTRTPLWAAEHLTKQRILDARRIPRVNAFHEEPSISPLDGAHLADYKDQPKFDRGHAAPSGDMPTAQAQKESFTLANMMPQIKANNEGIWSRIEGAVRDFVVEGHDVYVVTEPVFKGAAPVMLNGRVAVPAGIIKAVHDATAGTASAYYTDNGPMQTYAVITIDAARDLTGIDPFPALPESVKGALVDLPKPGETHASPAAND